MLTLGSSTLTAVESIITGSNGQLTTEAMVDGTTVIEGGGSVAIDGHTLSFGTDGLVVDATETQAISALPATAITEGAVIRLGSLTATALETVVTGNDGRRTTEAVVDGNTPIEGGPAVTENGYTLSFGPDGIEVDGTQTDPISALGPAVTSPPLLTPVVFTEHGRTFTATPVPGKTGVFIVDGKIISMGGPQVTVDGMTLTALASDLLVDGTETVSFGGHGVTAGLSAATAPPMADHTKGPSSTSTSDSGKSLYGRSSICFVLTAILLLAII